jgi:hypothetical protein
MMLLVSSLTGAPGELRRRALRPTRNRFVFGFERDLLASIFHQRRLAKFQTDRRANKLSRPEKYIDGA